MVSNTTIFLKSREGEALGPLPLRALEVLFNARVVDERTPVSTDGRAFHPLGEVGDLAAAVRKSKEILVNGGDPWPDFGGAQSQAPIPDYASLPPIPPGPAAPKAPPSLPPGAPSGPIRGMFECAVEKRTGSLHVVLSEGRCQLDYKDGKVVDVLGI